MEVVTTFYVLVDVLEFEAAIYHLDSLFDIVTGGEVVFVKVGIGSQLGYECFFVQVWLDQVVHFLIEQLVLFTLPLKLANSPVLSSQL